MKRVGYCAPALTMQAPWEDVTLSFIAMLLALTLVAACFVGYFKHKLSMVVRIPVLLATIGILFADGLNDNIRIGLLVALIFVLNGFHIWYAKPSRPENKILPENQIP